MPVPVCQCTQSVVPALGDDAAALAGQVEVGDVQAEDRLSAPARSPASSTASQHSAPSNAN